MAFVGKVVIITGAGTGIGAATAHLFAERGAKVVLVGRRLEKLQEVEAVCKKLNKNAEILIVQADVTKDSKKIITGSISKFGKLDVLINNAGISAVNGILDSDVAEFDKIMNTNLRAVYILTKLAIPHLLKTKGTIINVSSVAGILAFPIAVNYCISKAALDQFTKCLALELAPKGVRVNSVNPATIKTDLLAASGISNVDAYLEKANNDHPLGRVGEPSEVAKSIAFLASDDASFITGTLLCVDGGRVLQPYKPT